MADRFPSRRRAAQFARLVDGDESATSATLGSLVGVVSALQAVPAVQPPERFRGSLRTGLMEAAAVELVAAPSEPPGQHRRSPRPVDARQRRKLVAAAGSLVLVSGMSAVAAASQQALPGDTLYPVKRGIETVELTMAGSQRAEGRELLEQAEDRLAEVYGLAARGSADARVREDVTRTLQQFTADAGRGGQVLIEAYRSGGTDADLMQVRTFSRDAADRLSDLVGGVPGEAEPALGDAVSVIESLDAMALRACLDCTSSLPPLDVEFDLLSVPRVGDADYLKLGDVADLPVPTRGVQGGRDARASGASPEGDADNDVDREPHRDEGGAAQDGGEGALPLTEVPSEPLDDNDPSPSPSRKSSDGDLPASNGPVLDDDGVLGTDGPLLRNERTPGSDGSVRDDRSLLDTESLLSGLEN